MRTYKTRVSHLIPLIKEILSEEMLPDIQEAKRVAAEELLRCIQEDYQQKSLGHRGVDGIQWEATKKFAANKTPMLYISGRLFNSFEIEITDTGFKIFTDLEYARRQFQYRPPWPEDHLPAEWIQRMLRAAKPFLLRAFAYAAKEAVRRGEGGRVLSETIR